MVPSTGAANEIENGDFKELSGFALARIGRFEAFKAVRSWFEETREPTDETMLAQTMFWYLSGNCNFEIDEAECEYIADFPITDLTVERPAADWIEVLKVDHHERLSEGGEGYVDLVSTTTPTSSRIAARDAPQVSSTDTTALARRWPSARRPVLWYMHRKGRI